MQSRSALAVALVVAALLAVLIGSTATLASPASANLFMNRGSRTPAALPKGVGSWEEFLEKLLEHAEEIKTFIERITDLKRFQYAEDCVKLYSEATGTDWSVRAILVDRKPVVQSDLYETQLLLEQTASHMSQVVNLFMNEKPQLTLDHYIVVPESDELCDGLSKDYGCVCNTLGHCQTGTMKADPWTRAAVDFQFFELGRNRTLNQVQWMQSHNAYNTRANGYGLEDNLWGGIFSIIAPGEQIIVANHEFSLTDQLNAGVRALEFDPHWFNGKIRLCHSGIPDIAWVDKLVAVISKIIGRPIDWCTTELVCGLWDRPYADGIAEVADWLKKPENQHEIINFYFENHYRFTFGKNDLINNPIRDHLGDLVYTPADRAAQFGNNTDKWPTVQQMIDMGKRVVIGTNDDTNGGVYVHQNFWTEWGIDDLAKDPFPHCLGTNETMWSRVYGTHLCYPPIEESGCKPPYPESFFPERVPWATDCGITWIGWDRTSPALTAGGIWSWAPKEPRLTNACVVMDSTSHWITVPCSSVSTPYRACRNLQNDLQWTVGSGSCPSGYVFDTPVSGKQNHILWLSASQSQQAASILLPWRT